MSSINHIIVKGAVTSVTFHQILGIVAHIDFLSSGMFRDYMPRELSNLLLEARINSHVHRVQALLSTDDLVNLMVDSLPSACPVAHWRIEVADGKLKVTRYP